MLTLILFVIIALICTVESTSTFQDNQSENNCNICCQGVAGIPGVPGAAGPSGHNGLPGRDGIKGERGMSIKGDPGAVGQKGQTGESGRTRRSAFMAVKTNDQTGNIGDKVTFQETFTNINNHFSLQSNIFTCQIPGVYVFMFSLGVWQPTDPLIQLMRNGNFIVAAHTRTIGSHDFDQTSNSAILILEEGDQVWIQFGHHNGRSLHSNTNRYTSFSGFLLYEN